MTGRNGVSRVLLWVVLFPLLATASTSAHHSVLPYDGTAPTTVSGKVTRVLWQNPHTYIYLDVADDQGVTQWTVECEAVVVLKRLGWNGDMILPGSTITSMGARARDGRPAMRCATVTLATGQQLPCFPGDRQRPVAPTQD